MTPDILFVNSAVAPTAHSVDECKTACLNNTDCTGIDYHLNPITGSPAVDQRCYIVGALRGARKAASYVKHYDLTRDCSTTGQENGH